MILPSGYGVGIPWQRAENDPAWYDVALDKLQPPHWYNWKYDQLQYDNYTPMLWRMNVEWVAQALPVMAANVDRLWLLGNEPEQQRQSNTPPDIFANAMQILRSELGDWAFEMALPGVFWDRFGHGREWLDEYLEQGGPIPNAWAVHMYQPTSRHWISAFPDMISHLRSIADIPILLTECGCSYDNVDHTHAIMEQVKKAIHDGDVQAAMWFSAYYEADMPWSNLLTHDGELTEIGQHYMSVKDVQAESIEMTYLPNVNRA